MREQKLRIRWLILGTGFLLVLALTVGILTQEKVEFTQSEPQPTYSNTEVPVSDKNEDAGFPPIAGQNQHQKLQPPPLPQIREEVAENPHGPAPSFLDFAEELAERMEEASNSPEAARDLYDELEECVTSEETQKLTQILALCLGNAERLAELYPELAEKYRELHASAPGEALRLLKAADALEQDR